MIRVFDKNLNLITKGTLAEVLKINFENGIKLGEKNALDCYNFCEYLIKNNIKISNDSLLENIYMDYSRDCKIETSELQDNDSTLDFWDEYYKYLLKNCKDIYELIKKANNNDIKIDVCNHAENIETIHTINNGMFKIGYMNYKYLFIKD